MLFIIYEKCLVCLGRWHTFVRGVPVRPSAGRRRAHTKRSERQLLYEGKTYYYNCSNSRKHRKVVKMTLLPNEYFFLFFLSCFFISVFNVRGMVCRTRRVPCS